MNAPRLDLIFFWHMHQPDYRDHANGEFIMPWTYLRGRLSAAGLAAAEAQPSFCESSDWFWWFGDYNPSQAVISFDQIFRRNLAKLYRCLQLAPPAQLKLSISTGRADAVAVDAGGALRHATAPTYVKFDQHT